MRYQGCTRRWGGCKQEGIFSCQPQSCPLISSQEGSWSHQRFPRQLVPNTTSSEQSPPGGAGDTEMPGRAHISTDARATGEHEAATCCRTPCARSSRPWDLPPVHGAPAQRCLHRARPDKRQRQHSGSLGTPPPSYRGLRGRATRCCRQCLFGTHPARVPAGATSANIPLLSVLPPSRHHSRSGSLASTGCCPAHQLLLHSSCPARGTWGDGTGLREGGRGLQQGHGAGARQGERLQLSDTVRALATRTLQGPKA